MAKVKPLRVYVETSVWNFVFAEDVPDHREHTLQFFDQGRRGFLHPVISRTV